MPPMLTQSVLVYPLNQNSRKETNNVCRCPNGLPTWLGLLSGKEMANEGCTC